MDLQTLLAEREIVRGLGRFARIVDGREWSAVGDVFADDIVFDYGDGGEKRGMAALLDQFARFLDPCGPSQHLIGSIMVEVDGDTAVSRAYVQARHQPPKPAPHQFFDTSGEYIDRWERRPEGWRIVRRDARWLTSVGDPAIIWGA
jgi:ketosteroid isomerase-like protein